MTIAAALVLLAAPGVWQLQDRTAPLDGRRDVAAALEADSTIQRPFRPILVLMCDGRKPSAALLWAGYLGRPGYDVAVSWRVDGRAIHTGRWWIRSSALFLRSAGDVRQLQAELATGRTFVVRAGGQDATFTVGDVSAALAAVRAVCP